MVNNNKVIPLNNNITDSKEEECDDEGMVNAKQQVRMEWSND